MGILRTRMEQALVIRGLSERTGRTYLRHVEGLTRHYGRAPDTLVRRQSNRDHEARVVRDSLQPVDCPTPLVDSSVSVA